MAVFTFYYQVIFSQIEHRRWEITADTEEEARAVFFRSDIGQPYTLTREIENDVDVELDSVQKIS